MARKATLRISEADKRKLRRLAAEDPFSVMYEANRMVGGRGVDRLMGQFVSGPSIAMAFVVRPDGDFHAPTIMYDFDSERWYWSMSPPEAMDRFGYW